MEDYGDASVGPDEDGSLVLSYRELEDIPLEIYQWPHSLLSISLSHNNLLEIPAALGSLVLLRSLDISFNRIQRIDPALSSCLRLRRLNISHNQLTHVPLQLANCSMLEQLNISHNRLVSFPEDLSSLPALSDLILDNNNLTEIPTSLCLIPTLKTVSCQDNPIGMIPNDARSNTNIILWCLKTQHEYNEKIGQAQATCEDLQAKATAAAASQQQLEGQIEAFKKDVDILVAERPTEYLERRKRFLTTKAMWWQRLRRTANIFGKSIRALRSSKAAKISHAKVAGTK